MSMSKIAKLAMLLLAVAPLAAPLRAQDAERRDDSVEASDRGDDFYCGERRLGQWFYCTKPKPPESAKAQPQVPEQSAADRLAAITRQLDELKARAILDPSEENVIAYVRFQREQLDRASTFSDTWQRALWQNPDIDYTLQRPVNTVAKRAWLDNRKADRDQVLTNLGQRYGLFYFYAQTRAKFAQRDVKLSNKLQVTMQIINRSIMLESTLQNTMTPGMSSALNFSRGLNAQGLL